MGWGSGNLGGAGGGLNFVVKQYTETPTGTAKENTIAVVTDTAITSWVMQAEQPTGAEGMVWIEVAAASDVAFFADRKQQVRVYPASVFQYVSSAWVEKESFVYQGETWVQFGGVFIYDAGKMPATVEGGTLEKNATVTYQESNIHIALGTGSASLGCACFGNVDLSRFDTLRMDWESPSNSLSIHLYIARTEGVHYYNNSSSVVASSVLTNQSNSGTITLDVSGQTGTMYVYAGIGTNNQSYTVAREGSILYVGENE